MAAAAAAQKRCPLPHAWMIVPDSQVAPHHAYVMKDSSRYGLTRCYCDWQRSQGALHCMLHSQTAKPMVHAPGDGQGVT